MSCGCQPGLKGLSLEEANQLALTVKSLTDQQLEDAADAAKGGGDVARAAIIMDEAKRRGLSFANPIWTSVTFWITVLPLTYILMQIFKNSGSASSLRGHR